MEQEIRLLMENISAQQKKIDLQQDTINSRLDSHEALIGNIRVELSKNSQQQQVLIDSIGETREELRQMLINLMRSEMPQHVKKAVKDEIRLTLQRNPRKAIERKVGILEQIKLLFTKNK